MAISILCLTPKVLSKLSQNIVFPLVTQKSHRLLFFLFLQLQFPTHTLYSSDMNIPNLRKWQLLLWHTFQLSSRDDSNSLNINMCRCLLHVLISLLIFPSSRNGRYYRYNFRTGWTWSNRSWKHHRILQPQDINIEE